jgi:4-amino-4-deoxy-L-arabinose transferase-like glycosyltransferase
MEARSRSELTSRRHELACLLAILALGLIVRLPQLHAPIADHLQAKQAYSSNKARNIARTPFNPMRLSLDLLDDQGRPMELAEEVPLYIGMLGAAFRLFGESEAWGRLLSILASLVAIAAFYDWATREYGVRVARAATLLFSVMPLFVFYGRAVMPDAWMLAMMLACAAAYRRFLDSGKTRWLILAALCGAFAPLFKYWALMILIVLADMARRAGGFRAWTRPPFLLLSAALVLPTALWTLLFFAGAPNPVHTGWVSGQPASPYFVFQNPGVLRDRTFYGALFSRFLARDCGPIAAALLAVGILAWTRRRFRDRFAPNSLLAWTAMGLLFYVALAPKLIDHDYYELMMLPAAAVWAALGWFVLVGDGASLLRRRLATATLVLAVGTGLPWAVGAMFRVDEGKVALGQSLKRHSPSGTRVVALSPAIAMIVPIHYSQRAGWTIPANELPGDWPARLARWYQLGARVVGLYFDAKTEPAQRASFQPLIDALPILEHRTGGHNRRSNNYEFEYIVLRLNDTDARRIAAQNGGAATRR